jgi:hypothetical protein
MKKEKVFYQLLIEAQINEDWQGTIFRSMLYASKNACIEGCCKGELEEIIEIIQFGPHEEVNPRSIRKWLKGKAEAYLAPPKDYDDIPIFWKIVKNSVAT